ncbi:MAG: hypothetical protein ACRED0_01755 [Gammaproteobacteria bacterium]
MHIEAELDDIHAKRLIELQQRLQKPLPEVLATAIDIALNQSTARDEGEPSPIYQAFEEAGLIGCIETDEQLSTTYKQKLDFSHKHGQPE